MPETRRPSANVIQMDIEKTGAWADPVWFLLRSDAHHDAVGADRELEEKHLREALDRKAYIQNVYHGDAQLPRTLANPGTWGYGRDAAGGQVPRR